MAQKPGDNKSSTPWGGQPIRPGSTTNKPAAPAKKKSSAPQATPTPKKQTTYGPYQQEATRRGVSTGMGSRRPGATTKTTTGTTTGATTTGPAETPTTTKPKTPAPNVAPTATTPVDWEEAAKELYGGYFEIIQSVPELKDLLQKAVANKWGDAQFEYALRQTAWWKQNSATARSWYEQSQLDPATVQQEINNRVVEFQNIAMSDFGVQLDPARLSQIAADSIRWGFTEQMVKNAIGLEIIKSERGLGQLAAGFLGQTVRQTANAYGLKMPDDMLNRWVSSIAIGQETKERFQQYALNTAKQLFPAIAPQLDTGLTFEDIVFPYRKTASDILEISGDLIDFTEPKWARAISSVDSNGQQRPMTYGEWNDYLRNDPSFGYEFTSNAQEKAFRVANQLANLFGQA